MQWYSMVEAACWKLCRIYRVTTRPDKHNDLLYLKFYVVPRNHFSFRLSALFMCLLCSAFIIYPTSLLVTRGNGASLVVICHT